MLEGALVLHLDSRHTLAAIRAATLARDKGVLVSVEVEKDRPNLAGAEMHCTPWCPIHGWIVFSCMRTTYENSRYSVSR